MPWMSLCIGQNLATRPQLPAGEGGDGASILGSHVLPKHYFYGRKGL